ncbi:MAG: UDP-N-acetylmuramoyl-L-alanine--D-glutamate ligase [bacterium]|nr:UDP-N-acetylmuramoyl-L-alanine--D-glutamate ligase [bacterium]
MTVEMTQRALAPRDPDLHELRVLVIGMGKSGVAAARLAASHGARVTVADNRRAEQLEQAVSALRTLGCETHTDGHPAELAAAADLLIVSPGVPPTIDVVREAARRELPVWGEVELAARFCRGKVVGITGSNGKSTVTSMCGTILRGARIPGGTGGNLDTPFSDLLAHDGPDAVHAVELSSFQLEATAAFRPAVSVVLNLSPDHQDRYDSYDDYARAKARVLTLQETTDDAVLNADDTDSRRFDDAVRGRRHLFSLRGPVERGAFVRDGRLVLRTRFGEDDLLGADELAVPGEHNVANALAAALACRLAGCDAAAVADGLRSFRALSHRLEPVGTVGGVTFYNDSKATNPSSVLQALTAFDAGSVRLILGGRDKGADWKPFVEAIAGRVRQVLLVGEAATALLPLVDGIVDHEDCETIERAVRAGLAAAQPGDVVLLSPACASFDQYTGFEARGDDFRRVVLELQREAGDA